MTRKVEIISNHLKIAILLCLSTLSPDILSSQGIRAGAAYLKILPGTRQQNLAGSLTGSLDGTFSVYANPGATGFLREWQFSASYTKWIANISHTSLFYGQQFRFRTPLTEKLYVGIGLNRQGFEDFDASGGNSFVNASDMLASLSLGLPVKGISRNLSIGTNIKYFRSELAQYNASTLVFDAGIIFRTSPRPFDFLFSEQIIFSAGAAVTHLGKPLTFIAQETPLPRTFRAGIAFNLGKHDGVQLQLATDYRKVRDEAGRVGLGLEIVNLFGRRSWGRLMTVRGGYIFDGKRDQRLFNKFSLGLSFRLDDYINTSRHANKANPIFKNAELRLDGGFLDSKTFSDVYQGSVTYRPLGPEPFQFIESDSMSFDVTKRSVFSYQVCDSIELAWEATNDPDLYDEVNYLLLITKNDSTVLNEYIELAKRNEINSYLRNYETSPRLEDFTEVRLLHIPSQNHNLTNGSSILEVVRGSKFLVHKKAQEISHKLYIPIDAPGHYFWTVLAYDQNRHFRVIETSRGNIARFYTKPAPLLTITMRKDELEKRAYVKITNTGELAVDKKFLVRITAFDSTESKSILLTSKKEPKGELAEAGFYMSSISQPPQIINWESSPVGKIIKRRVISELGAGDSLTFKIELDKAYPYIIAEIDSGNIICANKRDTLSLYDLELKKTVVVAPFRPRVFFLKVGSWNLTRPAKIELRRLSSAFKSDKLKDVCIKIDGHTDEQGWPGRTSKENDTLNQELSLRRVESVRNYLISQGVDSNHVFVQGYGRSHPRIPNVKLTYIHLEKTDRDSLHRINRRVEMYLIRKKCKEGLGFNCSISSAVECTADTLKIINAGDELKYVFNIQNHGAFTARDIGLEDIFPQHLIPVNKQIFTSGVGNSNYLFSHKIEVLAPDSMITIKLLFTVRSTLPDTLIEIVNTAVLSAQNDMELQNNASSDTIYVFGGRPPNIEPVATNVKIKGRTQVRDILRGSYDFYDPDRDLQGESTFRWLRDGVVINGETGETYKLQPGDKGLRIQFEVTPVSQSGAGPGSAVKSARTSRIRERPNSPPFATDLEIVGKRELGSTLQASYRYNDYEGDRQGESIIRWFRNGSTVSEQTGKTYKLSAGDKGSTIGFEITPIARSGETLGKTVRSPATGPIHEKLNSPPQVASVEIRGILSVDQILTGSYVCHDPDGDPLGQATLRWLRNDVPIPGATSGNYKLRPGDLNAKITFEVTPTAQTGVKRGKSEASSPTQRIKRYRPR